jgi:hypothetical protein
MRSRLLQPISRKMRLRGCAIRVPLQICGGWHSGNPFFCYAVPPFRDWAGANFA